jgi:hypothetical protein
MRRVAAFDADRRRVGKIHRTPREVTSAGVNRSHYQVVCGRDIKLGLPVESRYNPRDLCLRCFPIEGGNVL